MVRKPQTQHPETKPFARRAVTAEQEQDLRRQLYEQRIAALAAERETMRFRVERIEQTAATLEGEALVRTEAEHVQAEFAVEQIERESAHAREALAALT